MSDRNAATDPASIPTPENRPTSGGVDREVVLIATVWAIVYCPIVSLLAHPSRPPTQRVAATIDPNEAPWWELAALPRVGETLARRLTALQQQERRRDGSPSAFQSPSDLQRVRGIGPKTVRRIAPFLHFRSTDSHETGLAARVRDPLQN